MKGDRRSFTAWNDSGAAVIADAKQFVGTDQQPGLLTKGSITVIMPDVTTISAADKRARKLNGARFGAFLEGAVHEKRDHAEGRVRDEPWGAAKPLGADAVSGPQHRPRSVPRLPAG